VWPRVREEGDAAEHVSEETEPSTTSTKAEKTETDESYESFSTEGETVEDESSTDDSFETRAEDFVNPREGAPFDDDDDDDDDEWNDAGEGYSSERPWDATGEEEEEEEEDAAYDEASDADFFRRVGAAAESSAETRAEDSEDSEDSADSEDSDSESAVEEPDGALPPKLPDTKPKGKGKWAKLRED
jgi:hypothetical protein